MTRLHRHRAKMSFDRGFTGPIPETMLNRCAHGGITRRETCVCGAVRDININGRHRETGFWGPAPVHKVTHATPHPIDTPAYLRRLWPIDPRD